MKKLSLREKVFIFLQHCAPQHLISRIAGSFADCRIVWIKNLLIKQFIKHFNVNMEEAENQDYRSYATFNEFFTRPLQPSARPYNADTNIILSPADGMISENGQINNRTLIQAKGQDFDLGALLGGDDTLTSTFSNGQFVTIYLSPKDYHRVHMSTNGKLLKNYLYTW